MAMRVKHAERKLDLAEEMKLAKLEQFDEQKEIRTTTLCTVHVDVYRRINDSKYLLYVNGGIYIGNKRIESFDVNYEYYYHGNDFRRLIKKELKELRNCLIRLRKEYNNVRLIITRSFEV